MDKKRKEKELLLCYNQNCNKTQCARHWRRHRSEQSTNLNPYDEAKCRYYLSQFNAPRPKKETIEIPRGKVNGGEVL